MRYEFVLIAILLLSFLVGSIFYAHTNSITSDEKPHIMAGYLSLKYNDYRFNIEHPPFIKQIAAIPLLFMDLKYPFDIYKKAALPTDLTSIERPFLYGIGNNLDKILFYTRLPNILIGLLLGIFIYLYSKELNGILGGLISLSLFVFSPNFLAHTPLVTTDVGISCFYLITIYFFMHYMKTKRVSDLILTGLFLGISLISKYSGLILVGVIYLLGLLALFFSDLPEFHIKRRHFIFIIPLVILVISYKYSLRMIAPAFFIYLSAYIFFKRPNISKKIQILGKTLLTIFVLGFVVVVLDYTDFKWFPFHSSTKAYFKGFAYFSGHAREGHGAYLLGRYSPVGWWYYFPLAMLFKTPIASLIIITLGMVGLFIKKENIYNKLLVLIPPATYLFIACFINKVNIGIRHILPVYPFLYVIGGYCLSSDFFKNNRLYRYVFIPAFLFSVAISSLTSYPRHLSYFNIAAGGYENGYKLLGDSNIAWGQDWNRLRRYIKDKGIGSVILSGAPGDNGYYGISYRMVTEREKMIPRVGCYVVDVSALQNKKIIWADYIEPSDRVGGSLLVYNITPREIDIIKEKDI